MILNLHSLALRQCKIFLVINSLIELEPNTLQPPGDSTLRVVSETFSEIYIMTPDSKNGKSFLQTPLLHYEKKCLEGKMDINYCGKKI